MIRKAMTEDLEAIGRLAAKTRAHMLLIGLEQWVGNYPNKIHFQDDIDKSGLYVYTQNNQIYGSMSLLPENDPAYKAVRWQSQNAMVIHRLFVDPNHQKQGVGQALFAYAQKLAKNTNYDLKIDTHPDNHRMQALIKKMGFEYKGYLSTIHRYAYEWLRK